MGPATKSRLVAEVKCYLCGRVCGMVESAATSPLHWKMFRRQGASEPAPMRDWRQLRCQTCGGPTYLDELQVITQRIEPTGLWSERQRRGAAPAHPEDPCAPAMNAEQTRSA